MSYYSVSPHFFADVPRSLLLPKNPSHCPSPKQKCLEKKWEKIVWQLSSHHCSQYIFLILLGPVVQRLIRANQGLNFNVRFIIPLFKSLFGTIFFILFSKRHSIIIDKGNCTEYSFKAFRSKSGFALTLDYLKLASNNLEITQALGLL